MLDEVEANPRLKGVPVVIISNAPLAEDKRKELTARVYAFLDKDVFDRAEFERFIVTLLADKVPG